MVAKLNPPELSALYPQLSRDSRELIAGMDQSRGSTGTYDQMLRNAVVRQQYGESCCGEALSQMASAVSATLGNRLIYSSLAAYYWGLVEEFKWAHGEQLPDADQLVDDGTFPYACELGWRTNGLPTEQTWPHDENLLLKCPGWGAVAEGMAHTEFVATSLDSSDDILEDIVANIKANHPVGITIPVDRELLEFRGSEPVGPRAGTVLGLHRIPLLGVSAKGLPMGLNSWGDQWGNHGMFQLTPEFIRLQAKDVVALVRASLL